MILTFSEKVTIMIKRCEKQGQDFCAMVGVGPQTKSLWRCGKVKDIRDVSKAKLLELWPDVFSPEDFAAAVNTDKKQTTKRGSKAVVASTTDAPVTVPSPSFPPPPRFDFL